jgi:hypothetical protein
MAATFNWAQTHGASPGTAVDLGASGNLFNFKDIDDATAANYSTYPITAGNNSYEVWLRMHFTGSFNRVDNLQFWMSTDFSPNTGLSILWKGNNAGAYQTPIKTASTVADGAIPTSDPGTANVSIGTSLSGYLDAAGYSDYIVLQLQTTVSAAAGDTSLAVFTANYDES